MLPEFLHFFPCYICLFWAGVLLINIRKNSRAQNIWILVMITLAISTYCWSIYELGTDDYYFYTKLSLVETYTGLLYHTLIFFYFLAVLKKGPFKWKTYFWLIPPLTIGTLSLISYLLMGKEQSADFSRRLLENHERLTTFTSRFEELHYTFVLKGYYTVIAVQTPIMLTYILWRMLSYRWQLKEYFSNLKKKSLGNIYCMLAYLCLTIVISAFTWYIEGHLRMDILMVIMGIVYFFMGCNVYDLDFTADMLVKELKHADKQVPQQEKENVTVITNVKYNERLLAFMKLINEDKIFLQSDLRLGNIAVMMQTNRTYISQMVNNEYNCSFSDYINSRRVDFAINLMRKNPNVSQEYIARQVGFLHGSSLSRAFKVHSGMTYREYRKIIFPKTS